MPRFIPPLALALIGAVLFGQGAYIHAKAYLAQVLLARAFAESIATGDLDFSKWPEQTYNVNSTIDFPRMRDIFFANEKWRITGEGGFEGIFHLFKGGFNLAGQFHDAGLLDEIIVQVGSVTLGEGKPLLPRRIAFPPLSLTSVRAIGRGFAELRYDVPRKSRD